MYERYNTRFRELALPPSSDKKHIICWTPWVTITYINIDLREPTDEAVIE
jgi:hypothetical protein